MAVEFVLNGKAVRVEGVDPHCSLLTWLRDSGYTGSKEGCAEGECGACAVAVVSKSADGRAKFEPVNSCLVPLAQAHGLEFVTVEGVAAESGLHPVQRSLVTLGGSQCGYCTPGFVMSLFCEYYRPGRSAPDPEAIAGNLCRCTGYRPIAAALTELDVDVPRDRFVERLESSTSRAEPLEYRVGDRSFLRPTTLGALFEVLAQHPEALLIAGGTDVMVEVNQRYRRAQLLVSLDGLGELRGIHSSPGEWRLGAACTLTEIERALGPFDDAPALLAQLWPLFSSRLIRNRATLGGNLATASPIGDSSPVLLALDARVRIVSSAGERSMPLAEFFVGYRQTALAPGEIIAEVCIPKPLPRFQRFYKVSKRPLDDISTVAAAFCLSLDARGAVECLRAAFGGIAATPLRATQAEARAQGMPWNAATQELVAGALGNLGTPLSDPRGSAAYRKAMIVSLFEQFCVDVGEAS